jgi:glycosyltransferase involved in cell wall biosynthesis
LFGCQVLEYLARDDCVESPVGDRYRLEEPLTAGYAAGKKGTKSSTDGVKRHDHVPPCAQHPFKVAVADTNCEHSRARPRGPHDALGQVIQSWTSSFERANLVDLKVLPYFSLVAHGPILGGDGPSESRKRGHAGALGEPLSVCLVARSLGVGGAERQLVTLAVGLARRGVRVSVLVFYRGGKVGAELEGTGVEVRYLEKAGRWDVRGFFSRYGGILRELNPSIVYSFLAIPNLVCLTSRVFVPRTRLVWGIRGSARDLSKVNRLDRLARRLQVPCSRFAHLVVVNSRRGYRHYASSAHFPVDRMVVIQNGIDSERFIPDSMARKRARRSWDISDDAVVVGLVTNLDPVKGTEVFIEASVALLAEGRNLHFIVVGGTAALRAPWESNCAKLGISGKVSWLGEQAEMPSVYNGLDILVSSSTSEGFSNAIGEAMACGIPCVVTDVGDSSDIVGESGYVVTPGDVGALCLGISQMLDLDKNERGALGHLARVRVISHYSVGRMVEKSHQALRSLVGDGKVSN